MRYRVFFLLLFPQIALADEHLCLTISPHKDPLKSVANCTELLSSESLGTFERSVALENRGVAFRELGEFDKSIQDIAGSIALSEDTSTMRMLAWTFREVGRLSDAEALYTRVLERDTHSQGWLSRCVVRQDMERYEQALGDCQEALRQDGENLDTLFFTSRAYNFLDQSKEALPLTEVAIKLDPNDPRHLVEHVWALYQLGRTLDARKKAIEGLDKFPDEPNLSWFLSETR